MTKKILMYLFAVILLFVAGMMIRRVYDNQVHGKPLVGMAAENDTLHRIIEPAESISAIKKPAAVQAAPSGQSQSSLKPPAKKD